jgi:hypothetical protein
MGGTGGHRQQSAPDGQAAGPQASPGLRKQPSGGNIETCSNYSKGEISRKRFLHRKVVNSELGGELAAKFLTQLASLPVILVGLR